ncbi:Glutamyl-tRNA synthetase [Roseomonas mucosa]|uniref:Glutamate--tRNA ligase n=1 Tax=Roseomonas mucosa TaxID=207340 RepID=A0A379N2T3_9PROT|nr:MULTISPECIES: glutamate--tRNA ligase [Roseomonas]MBS5901302.1 glutamate--tRNA ligase [Acetobacteraceae bacterium]ATR20309.1 glutamate--tRNA ligase [Roseomonas sp. FDAARGOS_362]AWV23037.1 Glutamyl-tRNA synthetase [Roseomonas mucosa]MCG7351363.1 glutamate--tRNA ligase [Roseomonas mucosa]MCG7358151.1 glutamate--tRNA ligase [Roseomonas mucosa]
MTVRTRFAPSPTGYLHIGGARTALFNYLFARHHGGQYLLRIEDTDKARSTPEAVRQILESLEWLGLSPDEPPVMQSSREARHAEVARQLLAEGKAYLAFDTAEELASMREQAMKEGRPPRYDGRWRDRDPSEAPPGVPGAVRIKAPREGETVVRDLVQGEVRVNNAELDDMIILRSDGTPTYQHAVVVDDHDMAITHVIRGDDHLTNTFRQIMIYDAMGWPRPDFAHIPLIHGADGAKLSKRHGAVGALEFRDQGLLPEAVCNYLLRLGWGHGDEEIVPRDRAIELFELRDVGRSASRMDYTKLAHLNGVYIRDADPDRLAREVMTRLAKRGLPIDDAGAARVRALVPSLQPRARTLEEMADGAAFVLERPEPDAKAAGQLNEESRARLAALAGALETVEWDGPALETLLREQAEAQGVKLGALAQPLRAALTGRTQSPPIDAVLLALGREESLRRIRAA